MTTDMFVHGLWQVRDIEIGVVIIRKSLELGIERFLRAISAKSTQQQGHRSAYTREADFITQVVEATNAILGVLVIVVLDEAKAAYGQYLRKKEEGLVYPLHKPVAWSMIDLELLMSPKRRPQDSSMSSVVSGWRPRI